MPVLSWPTASSFSLVKVKICFASSPSSTSGLRLISVYFPYIRLYQYEFQQKDVTNQFLIIQTYNSGTVNVMIHNKIKLKIFFNFIKFCLKFT